MADTTIDLRHDAPGMGALLENIQRFEQAAADLELMVHEAHSATKAARDATRDLRVVLAEVKQGAHDYVDDKLQEFVAQAREEIGAGVDAAIRDARNEMRRRIEKVWIDRNGVDLRDIIGSWKEGLEGANLVVASMPGEMMRNRPRPKPAPTRRTR